MAWTQVANLKGEDGEAGPAIEIRTTETHIQWRVEGSGPGDWSDIIALEDLEGADGADGTGVTILGSYESEQDLENAHPTGNPGDAYLVDGDLYVWSDGTSEWVNVGNIQGPAGDNGREVSMRIDSGWIQWRLGDSGGWTNLIELVELTGPKGDRGATWFTGEGSPGSVAGQATGDLYLDTQSGTVYVLEA